ncbi:MAG: D-glycero-beta-D-manno-heptose 1-phosphate adenylyltransferase [Candidatus Zixiibacteriota bacterium]
MNTLRAANPGLKIVFTNGVFDILHRGHVEYLAVAKKYGDILVVGLNSDDSTRRLKGEGRPVHKVEDRAAVLLALKAVDYVVIFEDDTPEKLIMKVRPEVLVKGADYKISEIVGAEFVRKNGGEVRTVALTEGYSTTGTIKNINNKKAK